MRDVLVPKVKKDLVLYQFRKTGIRGGKKYV
jgi:hypothetical protein